MNINEEIKLNKWASDMAEQKASNLSQKKWCQMKGIPVNTFQYRCKRVRQAMEEKLQDSRDAAAIVPVQHTENSPNFARIELGGGHNVPSGINIKFNDTLVNIAPDAPEGHVRMVLEVIAKC